jgi:predicted nuclease of restriction endonuclease-like (RecB) superfamily
VHRSPHQEFVLSWTHYVRLLPLEEQAKRDFYEEEALRAGWSVRQLDRQINSMLYERTALSRKPVELAKQELAQLREEDKLTPDLVFRDPYLLDFLGLKDTYSEKDLKGGLRVAAYLTELPPRRLLQKKLHEAILLVRARLEEKSGEPGNA